MKRVAWFLALMIFPCFTAIGQVQLPYILNGGASQESCNCYTLTQDVNNTSGTIWNKNQVSLLNSFDYVFDVNLGCKDANGADGIGFILQTRGTNLGSTGQGIGFAGIKPSVGVIIDTFQNPDENDPASDHVAIQINGISDHADPLGNLAGPVNAVKDESNIEDCQWHLFRIQWDAGTHTMIVSVDKQERLRLTYDFLNNVFGGNPMVYWGFAGSTGGYSNLQQFCAALRPSFSVNDQQRFCEGLPIQFQNASSSFGSITRYWWDFGDGTTSTEAIPPPHVFPGAGNYNIKMVIEDNSGCVSDTNYTQVSISDYPVVAFTPNLLCTGQDFTIHDASTAQYGDVVAWEWDWGNGDYDYTENPVYPVQQPGTRQVKLTAFTQAGCATTETFPLKVSESADIVASVSDACYGDVSRFYGLSLNPQVPVSEWQWNLGDGQSIGTKDMQYVYPEPGNYLVQLSATTPDGCITRTQPQDVTIHSMQLKATGDTLVAMGQPLQLNAYANGDNIQFAWYPATGLNNPYTANPIAILQGDQTYSLRAESPFGCIETQSLHVKVYKGPTFYTPTAFTPNNDGQNDLFRAVSPGMQSLDYFRIWNRWGQLVFESRDLRAAWDGQFQGKKAVGGTYTWAVSGIDYQGKVHQQKGYVVLIR